MCTRSVSLRAAAKINLVLDVVGKRDDGYHNIDSVVTGVSLFDDLKVRRLDDGGVRIGCDDAAVPLDRGNLIAAAYGAARDAHAIVGGIDVDLRKRIPIGGGMGGGSSDAAATLVAINQIWGLGLRRAELERLGTGIGSDVPLFFSLPAAQIRGKGERVARVSLDWSGWFTLVGAGLEVFTERVYEAWRPSDGRASTDRVGPSIIQARNARELGEHLFNALQPAVVRVCPRMGELLDAIRPLAPRAPWISGAGSTVYIACDEEGEARSLESKLTCLGTAVRRWVVRSLLDSPYTIEE